MLVDTLFHLLQELLAREVQERAIGVATFLTLPRILAYLLRVLDFLAVLVTQHRRKFQDAALFDPNGRCCMRGPSFFGVTPKKFTRAQSTAIVELIALKLASDVRQTLFVDSTASLRANLHTEWVLFLLAWLRIRTRSSLLIPLEALGQLFQQRP